MEKIKPSGRSWILLVEDDNGEQWEDYHKWVAAAYMLTTDKTQIQIESEWKAHVVDAMAAERITVNPHWLNIMNDSKIKSRKTYRRILTANGFCSWLEKNYEVIKLTYENIHPIQL